MRVRVLTYNIAGKRAFKRPEHVARVAEMILEADADIVGLQEVVHSHEDGLSPEEALADLTGMHVAYFPAHHFSRYSLGNAVLSRERISHSRLHILPHHWPERRILGEVETVAAGLPVTLFCTHLVHLSRLGARIRKAQAAAVARVAAHCSRPHLLVGDLNTGPDAADLRPLRVHFGDTPTLNGLRSWPARRPLWLYDQIWPGPGWLLVESRALEKGVSDHRPVLGTLHWNGVLEPAAPAAHEPHRLRAERPNG